MGGWVGTDLEESANDVRGAVAQGPHLQELLLGGLEVAGGGTKVEHFFHQEGMGLVAHLEHIGLVGVGGWVGG